MSAPLIFFLICEDPPPPNNLRYPKISDSKKSEFLEAKRAYERWDHLSYARFAVYAAFLKEEAERNIHHQ